MTSARRFLSTLVFAAFLLVGGLASPAGAHPMSTSAVLLDIRDDRVEGEVQLPLDRLAIAVGRDLTATGVLGGGRSFLEDYTARHISAVGEDGDSWAVTLGTGSVRTIDGTAHLVYPLTIRPPDGRVTDFRLRYDVIVEELLTHKVIATVRYDFDRGILKTDDAETLGVLDWDTTSLRVPADEGSWLKGFATTAGLGIEHVGEGADHLLFLLMLLIPAPLVAAGGRWRAADTSPRRSAVRVVHVVSAFALGHSLTLALAASGVVHMASRPVETLIAFSIAVSAVHAIRPLVARGEVLIAVGFGLVHGLAFASLIGDLGLDRGSLVTTLLGFNLGIELTQLLVVALMMPSLLALARTTVYPAFRVGVAVIGLVFSASWMLERAKLTDGDPFEGVQTWLVGHPLLVAGSVAALAVAAHLRCRVPRVAAGR
ncbi:HupE/UreJ family protein [Streptomyces phaeoluteigriseus]|uniref:HupE/UreJ family protein n=1 Tax=Streptomyces phaeoluteigriseus TaxID=114686 RepID=A0ABY4Z2A3_9ACTN|nr:HupE/UreJ family protein [Streptomyces phaeoluteigriseus]USQ82467.1 HupE/UreJ family protein [Streptomyces phaeoluteigriseus]